MSAPLPRRAFLGQLARLPLIGGAVNLVGQPSAVAEPVTTHMLEAYKTWLDAEQRWLVWEMAERPEFAHYGGTRHERWLAIRRRVLLASEDVGQAGGYHNSDGGRSAADRAALVLSAVGCDWREG